MLIVLKGELNGKIVVVRFFFLGGIHACICITAKYQCHMVLIRSSVSGILVSPLIHPQITGHCSMLLVVGLDSIFLNIEESSVSMIPGYLTVHTEN